MWEQYAQVLLLYCMEGRAADVTELFRVQLNDHLNVSGADGAMQPWGAVCSMQDDTAAAAAAAVGVPWWLQSC
jgi:hypothetical protein